MSSGTATRPSGSSGPSSSSAKPADRSVAPLRLEAGSERHGRSDREHADAVRAELDREALREPADAELRRDVVRGAGRRRRGRRRSRRSFTITPPCPCAIIARAASCAPRNVPRRLTVEHTSQSSVGELEQRRGGVDAGGVHPDVQPPRLGERVTRRARAPTPPRARRRGRDCVRSPIAGCAPRAAALFVDVGDDDRRAGLGEPGAAGAPDSAGATGDDRDPARKAPTLGRAGRRDVADPRPRDRVLYRYRNGTEPS